MCQYSTNTPGVSSNRIWASAWDFQQCGMCDQETLRSACAYAQSNQSLCLSLEFSMNVKLLTEHHLMFLSLKGGYTGSSEFTPVNLPHCWKSHVRHFPQRRGSQYIIHAFSVSMQSRTSIGPPAKRHWMAFRWWVDSARFIMFSGSFSVF